MTAAFVGLIGVIAGALLGGLLNAALERQRRKVAAKGAGWLIAAELDSTVRRIESALDSGQWWRGDCPTEAWQNHAKDLAFEASRPLRESSTISPPDEWSEPHESTDEEPVPASSEVVDRSELPSLLERLAAAYAIVDRWNVDLADEAAGRSTRGGETVEANQEDLREDRAALDEASGLLKSQLAPPSEMRARAVRRWGAILAPIVLAPVFVSAAFVERLDVNEQTIARVLQDQVTPSGTVDCDSKGGDWICTTRRFERVRGACPTSARLSDPPRFAFADAERQPRECEVQRSYEAIRRGEVIEFSPSRRERDKARKVILRRAPKEALISKVWKWLKGDP